MIKWNNMTNTEIRLKMSSMEMEYESLKNKINNLMSQMETLDNEYNNAKKEIDKRSKK